MPHTHSLICHRPYIILVTHNVAPLNSAEEIIWRSLKKSLAGATEPIKKRFRTAEERFKLLNIF